MFTNPMPSKEVLIFGATGLLGSHVVKQALAAGYRIRIFARDPARVQQSTNVGVPVFTGESSNFADVEPALKGVDVVISCLGNTKSQTIMLSSHENILKAARKQKKQPRCIFISSVGCGGTSWLVKQMLRLIGGKASFDDYEAADLRISGETEVPFLLIRAYALNNKPGKGTYFITRHQKGTFLKPITRADVASFMVSAIDDSSWDGPPGPLLGGA